MRNRQGITSGWQGRKVTFECIEILERHPKWIESHEGRLNTNFMFIQTSLSSIVWEKLTKIFYSEVLRTRCRENDAFPVLYVILFLRSERVKTTQDSREVLCEVARATTFDWFLEMTSRNVLDPDPFDQFCNSVTFQIIANFRGFKNS